MSENPFIVELAKSGRSECKGCGRNIGEGQPRVGHRTKSQWHDGYDTKWHHVACIKGRLKNYRTEVVDRLDTLSFDDQEKSWRAGVYTYTGEEFKRSDDQKKRNSALWALKKILFKYKAKPLQEVCAANTIPIAWASEKKKHVFELAHDIADGILFGKLAPCPACEGPYCRAPYDGNHVKCAGWTQSGFSRCTFDSEVSSVKAVRYPFSVPDKCKIDELLNFKHPCKAWLPSLKNAPPPTPSPTPTIPGAASPAPSAGPSTAASNNLCNIVAFFPGRTSKAKKEAEASVFANGGLVTAKIDQATHIIVMKAQEGESKATKAVAARREEGFPVIVVDFVEKLAGGDVSLRTAAGLTKSGLLCAGSEAGKDLPSVAEEKAVEVRLAKKRRKPTPTSAILRVDRDASGGDVYINSKDETDVYSCVLNRVNMDKGYNSFYIMQILKSGARYTVFKKWGRVGNESQGGIKDDEKFGNVGKAMDCFKEKFKEITGNNWDDRDLFVKRPGRYYMVDLGDDEEEEKENNGKKSRPNVVVADSALNPRVKNFVDLIFDDKQMIKALEAMEIDVKKMPLGKISKVSIQEGLKCLKQIDDVYAANPGKSYDDLAKDAFNNLGDLITQFYHIIPHNCGTMAPPPITPQIIPSKMDMLTSLMDMEIAQNIMKETKSAENCVSDANYEKLKTKLVSVDEESQTFKDINAYMNNTHGSTHSQYTLILEDLFEVDREGEDSRFKPFADNEHRELLWHGSRLTNWVGILSQGLRIAPPEAPCTGYMFGKGVYFANACSKSANYTNAHSSDNTGLLALCEVALGEPLEKQTSFYVNKLPKGKLHCFGQGRTVPNKKGYKTMDNGCVIPMGKLTQSKIQTVLQYDEKIVYDVDQVRIRYLLKCKFNYKGHRYW